MTLTRRQELFAQARAEGLSPHDAYLRAGYAGNKRTEGKELSSLAKNAAVQARVAELAQARRTPPTAERLTEHFTRIALAAEAKGGAMGLSAARLAWVEVARINGLRDPNGFAGEAAAAAAPAVMEWAMRPPMTQAEWLEAYAPKDEPQA